jgi:hypothetical protein
MKKMNKNILSIFVLIIFVLGAIASAGPSHSGSRYSGNSSSSSSSGCELNYWVEKQGGSYVPYFRKTGNCGLSLDYALYYMSGEFFMDGHLYFTKHDSSPSSGFYAKYPIKIVIKSKKWD